MAQGTCEVSDCERATWARGMCSSHYCAWHREQNGRKRSVYTIECEACGQRCATENRGGKFCSVQCKGDHYRTRKSLLPADHPVMILIAAGRKAARSAPRSELRKGYEDRDPDLFFAALVAIADTSTDCWIWQRKTSDGYPIVHWAGRTLALHRIVLEVKHGAPLGSQAAHHVCANTTCVNPDHLQPVTHRENVAEMLARQSYLARITELEQALAVVAPQHPLLSVVKVA